MKNSSWKNGVLTISIISLVFLAILNVVTFAIPFPHISDAIHYTAYGLCEAMIIIAALVCIYVIFVEDNPNQKIISIPMVRVAGLSLITQTLLTTMWYILNALLVIPGWVMAIVEVIVLGYFLIRFSLGLFFKRRNKDYHENKADTAFIDNFRARLIAINANNKDDDLERPLQDLVDKARGTDPVGNAQTVQTESALLDALMELDVAVKKGNKEEERELITSIDNLLSERAVLCKTGK